MITSHSPTNHIHSHTHTHPYLHTHTCSLTYPQSISHTYTDKINGRHRVQQGEEEEAEDYFIYEVVNTEYGIRMCSMCKRVILSRTNQTKVSSECDTIKIIYTVGGVYTILSFNVNH